MSVKKLLLASALALGIAALPPAVVLAHGDEDHSQEKAQQAEHAAHADKAVSKATDAEAALTEIQSAIKEIGSMIAGGKFNEIHEVAEKATTAIKTLQEKSSLEGDKKTRLDAALKQLSAQLGKLHTASDSKDAEKTGAEFKKTEGALKLVENALK